MPTQKHLYTSRSTSTLNAFQVIYCS